jgi:hypothetical protein
MRLVLIFIVSLILVIGVNTFLNKLEYHNSILYSLFVIVMMTKLIKNIHTSNKFKKGTICKGEIISFQKKDEFEIAEINYYINVKFKSPLDNAVYNIKSSLFYKPKQKEVNVIINKKEPNKSKVIVVPTLKENLFLIIGMSIFIYLALSSLTPFSTF